MRLPLRAGETQRTTLRASDRARFVIDLEARGDYLLRVDQGGLDLVVTLTEPGGRSESFNSPLLRNEAELVLLADRPAGRYDVTLRTDEHSDTVATPAVELIAVTRSGDSREREALQAMSRGAAANFAGGDEAWRAAVAEYEHAAELWRELGRRREEAQALFGVAMVEFGQTGRLAAQLRARRARGDAVRRARRAVAGGERGRAAWLRPRRAGARSRRKGPRGGGVVVCARADAVRGGAAGARAAPK